MTKFYRDNLGNYLGAWDNDINSGKVDDQGNPIVYPNPYGEKAIEVPMAPENAGQKWVTNKWGPKPPEIKSDLEALKIVLANKLVVTTVELNLAKGL